MPKLDIPVDVLIQQLHSPDWTARCEAARLPGRSGDPAPWRRSCLTLPWYGEERSLESLRPSINDPDETVHIAATWATNALQKAIYYRNQFGM